MKNNIKFFAVVATSALMLTPLCNANDEFIIKTDNTQKIKKQSKNELKENIGQATKDAFNVSSQLGTQLGTLQQTLASLQMTVSSQPTLTTQNFKEFLQALGHLEGESGKMQVSLSSMQQHFSQIIEKLVDNRAPFKKAKPIDLTDALDAVQKVYAHLNAEITSCKKITQSIKNTNSSELQNAVKALEYANSKLVALNAEMQKSTNLLNNAKCLKAS